MPLPNRDLPIGVFDSGVGGLTVLRAMREALPAESLIYLGDTARLPYGTKSPETVLRYARQAAGLLVERGVKMLVIACNTASAHALPALREAFADIPVVGVIDPGADAAVRASASGRILVLATESTVQAGAYDRAILARRPDARVMSRPCPLFVALAEEGLVDGPIAESIARHYLDALFDGGAERPDTMVLGCTHFPTLSKTLRRVVPSAALIDSATTTAEMVARELADRDLATSRSAAEVQTRYLATDAPERFARVARAFLPVAIGPEAIELVDLAPQPVPQPL